MHEPAGVIGSQVEIRKKTYEEMTIDQNTHSEAMFSFLPHEADRSHANRLLLMLRSHGIRDTREVTQTEWRLLVERVIELALPA